MSQSLVCASILTPYPFLSGDLQSESVRDQGLGKDFIRGFRSANEPQIALEDELVPGHPP
jgi:hypothetical protein